MKFGDQIEVKDKSKKKIKDFNENFSVPKWLSFDEKKKIGKVIKIPIREEISIPVKEQLIVELYSR